jgi:hypothetical protein
MMFPDSQLEKGRPMKACVYGLALVLLVTAVAMDVAWTAVQEERVLGSGEMSVVRGAQCSDGCDSEYTDDSCTKKDGVWCEGPSGECDNNVKRVPTGNSFHSCSGDGPYTCYVYGGTVKCHDGYVATGSGYQNYPNERCTGHLECLDYPGNTCHLCNQWCSASQYDDYATDMKCDYD